GLQLNSHRSLFALLGDDLALNTPTSMDDVALRWCDRFWKQYADPNGPIAPHIAACKLLNSKSAFDASDPSNPANRTQQEERVLHELRRRLVSGFCIAGHLADRLPVAFEIIFDPLAPKPTPVKRHSGYWFWGVPTMVQRLIFACDDNLRDAILT